MIPASPLHFITLMLFLMQELEGHAFGLEGLILPSASTAGIEICPRESVLLLEENQQIKDILKEYSGILHHFIAENMRIINEESSNLQNEHKYREFTSQPLWRRNQQLQEFVESGNITMVKVLLATEPTLNRKDKSHNSLLHHAVSGGWYEICFLLLEKGIEINSRDRNGRTSLHIAVIKNETNIVNLLLEAGADMDVSDFKKKTALHYAVAQNQTDLSILLIDAKANVNVSDNSWETPLYIAVMNENRRTVQALIDKKANFKVPTWGEKSPFSAAVFKGNIDIVRFLIRAGVNASNEIHSLRVLTREIRADIARYLINTVVDDRRKAEMSTRLLNEASYSGNLNVLHILLNAGANISHRGYDGETALHEAAEGGSVETLRLLIHAGANIDAVNSNYMTPMGIAAKNGRTGAVKFLIEQGANINLTTQQWISASPLEVSAEKGYTDIVRLLLDSGAKVEGNVLGLAVKSGSAELVELLLNHGAKPARGYDSPLIYAIRDNYEDIVRLLLNRGVDAGYDQYSHKNPLEVAVNNNLLNVTRMLLEAGADVNRYTFRNAPLYHALRHKNMDLIQALAGAGAQIDKGLCNDDSFTRAFVQIGIGGIELLRKAGVNMQCTGILMEAAEEGNVEVCKKVLDFGANVNGERREVPLVAAAKAGHLDVVKLLVERGADTSLEDSDGINACIRANKSGRRAVYFWLLHKNCEICFAKTSTKGPCKKMGETETMEASVKKKETDMGKVIYSSMDFR